MLPTCFWGPWATPAAPGCSWLLLAASWLPPGCSWLLLAASWLLLAAPGYSWLGCLLAASWLLLAASWLLLAAPGCSWLLLAAPGYSWLRPGSFRLPQMWHPPASHSLSRSVAIPAEKAMCSLLRGGVAATTRARP